MNYSQALESLIQEIGYYGDSAERREKVHRQALLDGVDPDNSLFMFKKYCSKDFCNTYDKYEKFLNGDFGSLDYDVWTQAQDTDGFKYKVSDIRATDDRNVTITMDLTNFGTTQQLKVKLIKEDKWVIDDFVNAQHSAKQLMREDMNQ